MFSFKFYFSRQPFLPLLSDQVDAVLAGGSEDGNGSSLVVELVWRQTWSAKTDSLEELRSF